MRALVIDDSRAIRRILGRMLGDLGFDVSEATDGGEGLAALHAGDRPDVVLVDWNMPGMDGLSFVRAVRSEHAYDDVLVMMVSSESGREQVIRALRAGADEYAMKPFTSAAILEKLAFLGLATSEPS